MPLHAEFPLRLRESAVVIHPYSYYLARAARRWPNKTAIVDGSRSLTYAELDERASRLAAALGALGVGLGDRVAIVQENNYRYVETVCAVARAGGVFVPMLGALTEREHSFIVADAGARVLVALGGAGAERALSLAAQHRDLRIVAPGYAAGDYEKLLAAHEPWDPRLDCDPQTLGQILYTSGTTGTPKGVMHSFASMSAGIGAWVECLAIRHADRLLGHFALSHFGGRAMDSAICAGATLVILPRPDPERILAALAENQVTILLMVPTLMQAVLDHPNARALCPNLAATNASVAKRPERQQAARPEASRSSADSLRLVLYAAAPASPSLVRRALEAFGPVLATGFGQTEAYGLNTFLSPAEHTAALEAGGARLASIGREASAWVQVRLLGPDGTEVPPGKVGEICVCAPWVMKGYWQSPELTAQILQNGWLHTRDLGWQDADGYVYIADRKDDVIISGGYNIYPREVEDVLAAAPGVRECCVVGIPDPKWGEAVLAAVVAEGTSEAEILAYCRAHLAAFKVPKAVKFVSALPKSSVGKILRRVVREPFWRGHERQVHGAE